MGSRYDKHAEFIDQLRGRGMSCADMVRELDKHGLPMKLVNFADDPDRQIPDSSALRSWLKTRDKRRQRGLEYVQNTTTQAPAVQASAPATGTPLAAVDQTEIARQVAEGISQGMAQLMAILLNSRQQVAAPVQYFQPQQAVAPQPDIAALVAAAVAQALAAQAVQAAPTRSTFQAAPVHPQEASQPAMPVKQRTALAVQAMQVIEFPEEDDPKPAVQAAQGEQVPIGSAVRVKVDPLAHLREALSSEYTIETQGLARGLNLGLKTA